MYSYELFVFVLAVIVATFLTLTLISSDYKPDPGTEIGTALWDTWVFCCDYYFKSNRFYFASATPLGFAVLALLVRSA
jgi:hypothetical protein